MHRPHGESLERWGLLERVRAQEELHDDDCGLLVGGGVVLGARGGVDAAPAHKKFLSVKSYVPGKIQIWGPRGAGIRSYRKS